MTISVKSLTTHFIGVDMDYDDANELKDIATLGLENAYFHLAILLTSKNIYIFY